ncbi:MAG: PepSY-like domain-containing protein [Weeksellaceae bacterium]|jgi:hypothetical protein|nr:PepSY-like domain-containing protein [Weeksellaceae bacterium]
MNSEIKNWKTLFLIGFLLMGMGLSAQRTMIDRKDLPQRAQQFISENFNDLEIRKATKENESRNRMEYEVYFVNRTKVEFDGNGNWKEVDGNESPIPTGFIHSAIVNYVKQNYPNQQITQIEKSRTKFEVELTNGIDLDFSAEGNFLKADD